MQGSEKLTTLFQNSTLRSQVVDLPEQFWAAFPLCVLSCSVAFIDQELHVDKITELLLCESRSNDFGF